MAVTEQFPITSALANGVTTAFPFGWTLLSADDMVVQATVGGVTTTYQSSAYTISGIGLSSGTVTFFAAPASGVIITMYRDTALVRETDYQDNGDLLADTVNLDFDRLWMAMQDILTGGKVSPSAIRVPNGETVGPLPAAASRAGYFLGFDGAGAPALLAASTGTAAALAADLASASDAAKGDALVGVKSSLSNTVTTTAHEVNERTRNVFDWLSSAQKAAVLASTPLDMTAALQLAIDSGASLYWPSGSYYVNKLTFSQIGKTYWFQGAQIFAIDTGAQKGLIDLSGSDCNFYNMALFGQWKSNYTSLLYWHSASLALPAQANRFFGLALYNGLIGILFGEVSPTVAVDAPQSENFVYGFRTRGVERPIYGNQANGFIQIDGEVAASKNEWDIASPGVYSYTQACPITVLLGVVRVHGEVIKADTQLGVALRNSGGTLEVAGVIEAACQVFSGSGSGGTTNLHDITFGYWGNGTASWAVLAGTGGVLTFSNFLLNKAAAASSANTALVDLGGATGWEVLVSDSRLENQLNLIFANGSGQPHMWTGDNKVTFDNVTSLPVGGGTTPTFPRVSTSVHNLLDLRSTDVIGNDIGTWYKTDVTGVGAIALNADIPSSSNYFNSVQLTPAVTTGRSRVNSMDTTSLATVKATAIKCRPGETYMISGWFRMTTAGTAAVDILTATTAGAINIGQQLITQANLLTSSWRYLTAMFTIPASTAYFGVGMDCSAGTVGRMVGLRVARLGNEP